MERHVIAEERNDKWGNVTETARHREILAIYRAANAATRPMYDFGHYYSGPNEENWGIRWFLYHSFQNAEHRVYHSRQCFEANDAHRMWPIEGFIIS